MRPAVLCIPAVLICACTSMNWANSAGETASQQVISECTYRAAAQTGADTLASGTYVSAQSNAGARTGRTEYPWNQTPPSNTGIQEQASFNLCMRERGYELVPAYEHR